MSSDPHVFELAITVQPADIDQMGHVNNVAYVRWIQDVAVAHWEILANPADREKLRWVVVRHEIDYRRAAFLHDAVIARTWVGPATRLRFARHTELVRASDRAVLASARTLWCPIDARTGRPTDVSPEVRQLFSVSDE